MVGSLNDNSTETFWESCEEDRNKCKWVMASVKEAEINKGINRKLNRFSLKKCTLKMIILTLKRFFGYPVKISESRFFFCIKYQNIRYDNLTKKNHSYLLKFINSSLRIATSYIPM